MIIIIIIIIILIMTDDECCFSISHLERDLSQKRVLMDDIKEKLSVALENAETDASIMVVPRIVRLVDIKSIFTFNISHCLQF